MSLSKDAAQLMCGFDKLNRQIEAAQLFMMRWLRRAQPPNSSIHCISILSLSKDVEGWDISLRVASTLLSHQIQAPWARRRMASCFDELSTRIHRDCILSPSKEHPELVEGCRRMQHSLDAASTSSVAKFKSPKTPSPELVMEKSYFYKECVFQHHLLISEKPL